MESCFPDRGCSASSLSRSANTLLKGVPKRGCGDGTAALWQERRACSPQEAAWRRLTLTGGGAPTPASPPAGMIPEPPRREPGRRLRAWSTAAAAAALSTDAGNRSTARADNGVSLTPTGKDALTQATAPMNPVRVARPEGRMLPDPTSKRAPAESDS